MRFLCKWRNKNKWWERDNTSRFDHHIHQNHMYQYKKNQKVLSPYQNLNFCTPVLNACRVHADWRLMGLIGENMHETAEIHHAGLWQSLNVTWISTVMLCLPRAARSQRGRAAREGRPTYSSQRYSVGGLQLRLGNVISAAVSRVWRVVCTQCSHQCWTWCSSPCRRWLTTPGDVFLEKGVSWCRNLHRHRKLTDPLGCVPCKKCHGTEIFRDIESSPTPWDVFHVKRVSW